MSLDLIKFDKPALLKLQPDALFPNEYEDKFSLV